jgi:hypothetical protein
VVDAGRDVDVEAAVPLLLDAVLLVVVRGAELVRLAAVAAAPVPAAPVEFV